MQKSSPDTNILVYSIDRSAKEEKREVAKEIVGSGFKEEREFQVPVQCLEEFTVVSTSKIEKPISQEEAYDYIEEIVKFHMFDALSTTPGSALKASKIRNNNQISFWDCLIAAVMLENNVSKIYTENTEDFRPIEGIEAENPFSS